MSEGRHEGLERLEAEDVHVERASVGGVSAREVEARTAIVGGIRADEVRLERALVGGVAAERAELHQSFVRGVVAREATISQGGVGGVVAGTVTLGPTTGAVFVLAGRVDGDVRSVFDLRTGLVVAGVGAVLALLLRLTRARG